MYARHRIKAVEPELLEHGLVLRRGRRRLRGRPGPRRRARASPRSTTSHRRRRQRRRAPWSAGTGRGLRRFQTGYVRNYALGIGIGAVLLLGLVPAGGGAAESASTASRCSPSIIVVPARRRRSWWCSLPEATGPSWPGWSDRAVRARHRRPGGLPAGRVRPDSPDGFQFVTQHSLDRGRSASRGTSASTASRCSSSCSPACCSRSRCWASTPSTTTRPTTAGSCCSRPACMGTFLALDLFLFFVFFEVALVPMYFLIGGWGHGERVYAATKFFLYTMLGSASCSWRSWPRSCAVPAADRRAAHLRPRRDRRAESDFAAEHRPLAVPRLRHRLRRQGRRSSRCTPGCPTPTPRRPRPARSILAGVMLKLGTYGFLRFGLYLFPEAAVWFAPALRHARRRSASSTAPSCATMQKRPQAAGRLLVGGPPRLHRRSARSPSRPQSLTGGVLQMVNHGIVHRRPVPPRSADLRAPPHPRDLRAEGPPEGRARLRRRLHRGDAVVDRRARAQRLRRRVPHPDRHRSSPTGGGRWWPPPA